MSNKGAMRRRFKSVLGSMFSAGAVWLVALGFLLWEALPVLAAEESAAPDPTEGPAGIFFRWLNFAIIFFGFAFVLYKYGGPYFRARGLGISQKIRESAEARAAAESELAKAEKRVAGLDAEIAELKREATRDSAAETERIRALSRSDAEKIAAAAQAEIHAAERAAKQELRAIAARLATERAEALLKQRMSPAVQAAIFHSFVAQLPGSAS